MAPGGAVMNDDGTVTVAASTFSGNSATFGSGIANGGISGGSSTATVTVSTSTFSDNHPPGGYAGYSYGGAIVNYDSLTVTNSTFSGNSATEGAAIGNADGGTLTITNCTFSSNSADPYGGTIIQSDNENKTTLTNTIVANNTSGGNCSSTISDGGHNIDDSTSCGFSTANGSLSNTDPKLAAGLANNGGPTQTIALEAGSPAINAGNESACAAAPVNNLDQRGFVRPGVGATNCSVGAYEFDSSGPPPSTPSPTPSAIPTATATQTPSATAPPTSTATPSPSAMPTATRAPTASATPSASATATATSQASGGDGGCMVTPHHGRGPAWWLPVAGLVSFRRGDERGPDVEALWSSYSFRSQF